MTSVEQQIGASVLVIGTEGSGLRAAIELAERGIDVLIVGKRPKTDADDTWQQQAADTRIESYLLATR